VTNACPVKNRGELPGPAPCDISATGLSNSWCEPRAARRDADNIGTIAGNSSMTGVTEAQILEALRQVVDADHGRDVVDAGMVPGLVIKGGNVGFAIEVDAKQGAAKERLRKACEEAVTRLPGVTSATVVLTAETQGKAAP